MQAWADEFSKAIQIYQTYGQVSKTQIEFNIGHDDSEVVSGLQKLIELFEAHNVAKSFMVTDFGAIERYLLSSLQNIDEQVMLHSCLAIQSLVKGRGGTGVHDEGAQDILVKRSGIHSLKTCAMDEMIEIRKVGLDILCYLCQMRVDV